MDVRKNYLVRLVAIMGPVSCIVRSILATILPIFHALGHELRIFPDPQVHQRRPSIVSSIDPFGSNLKNGSISFQEHVMQLAPTENKRQFTYAHELLLRQCKTFFNNFFLQDPFALFGVEVRDGHNARIVPLLAYHLPRGIHQDLARLGTILRRHFIKDLQSCNKRWVDGEL
jgi:hypothetical protein